MDTSLLKIFWRISSLVIRVNMICKRFHYCSLDFTIAFDTILNGLVPALFGYICKALISSIQVFIFFNWLYLWNLSFLLDKNIYFITIPFTMRHVNYGPSRLWILWWFYYYWKSILLYFPHFSVVNFYLFKYFIVLYKIIFYK